MHLLRSGVSLNVIALRMCNESNTTMHRYTNSERPSAHAVPSDAETMHTICRPQLAGGIGVNVDKSSINAHSFVVRIGVEFCRSVKVKAAVRRKFVANGR